MMRRLKPEAIDKAVNKIPGWLRDVDHELIKTFLDATADVVGHADLAEIGVYMGRSAALIGTGLQPGETFTVLDLFGADAETPDNEAENAAQYPHLTQERFERHYLSVHDSLPTIVAAASDEFTQHVAADSLRFIHIDGSHLFDHVVSDVESARTTLKSDGIVVFDDIRTEHTPGVSAAVWQAVGRGLNPIVVTPAKFYGTWGDPRPFRDHIEKWLSDGRFASEVQSINGNDVFRIGRHHPLALKAYLRVLQWRHSR